MRRGNEDPGMAVEHVKANAYLPERELSKISVQAALRMYKENIHLGHLNVGFHSGFAIIVVLIEVDRILVLVSNKGLSSMVCNAIKDFIDSFNVRSHLECHLPDAIPVPTMVSEPALDVGASMVCD